MENENKKPELAESRLAVIKKMEELETKGIFDQDVLEDPPTIELKPGTVDYTYKKLSSRIKGKFCNFIAKKFVKKQTKQHQFILKDIVGLENWQNIETGAVLTCNHFNPFDNFVPQVAFWKMKKKNHLFKVIREGNYTNPPCFGFFFKNYYTLPLSSNKRTMVSFIRGVDELLKKGEHILVYPEQALWLDYRKPRPFKDGAFNFATKANVPVVPLFITMEDSEFYGSDGYPVQEYTLHVLPPIYPDPNLDRHSNIEVMKDKNYQMWKEVYEKAYGKKLAFTTKL